MKRCPVCEATLFEDMDTCFGCMYRFGTRPDLEQQAETRSQAGQPGSGAAATAPESCLLGQFLVELHRFLGDFLVDARV